MVTTGEQAAFAHDSFDLLFKEAVWPSGTPAIKNIFWYQYMDGGIPASECTDTAGLVQSASALTSFIARGAALEQPEQQDADWWFGLYQGIDFANQGVIRKNLVQCVFRKYPIDAAIPVLDCVDYIYLPSVNKQ